MDIDVSAGTVMTGLDVRDLTVGTAQRALSLRGYPDDPVHDVALTRVAVAHTAQPDTIENVDGLVLTDVTENGVPVG